METKYLLPEIHGCDNYIIEKKFKEVEHELKNLLYFSVDDIINKRINIIKENLNEYNIANIINSYDTTFTIYDYIKDKKAFINSVNTYFKLKCDYQRSIGAFILHYHNAFNFYSIDEKYKFYSGLFYIMKNLYNNSYFHNFIQKNKKFYDMKYYIPEINSINDIIDYDFLFENKYNRNLNIKNILLNFYHDTDIKHILNVYDILSDNINWLIFTYDFVKALNRIVWSENYENYINLHREILLYCWKNLNWKIFYDLVDDSTNNIYSEFICDLEKTCDDAKQYISENYNKNINYLYCTKEIYLGRQEWDYIQYIQYEDERIELD